MNVYSFERKFGRSEYVQNFLNIVMAAHLTKHQIYKKIQKLKKIQKPKKIKNQKNLKTKKKLKNPKTKK